MAPAGQQAPGLVEDLRRRGAWKLFPLLLLYVTGLIMMVPIVPGLMRNFFAQRRSSVPIDCNNYPPDAEPAACRDASSDVVFWSSCSSFMANSILSFALQPVLGFWSDKYGRKPFMLLAIMLASGPTLVLLLHMEYGLSLFFYYPASGLTGAVSAISLSLAYIADLLHPKNRGAAFGLIIAAFSLAVLIGPALGGILDPVTAATTALVLILIAAAYVALLLDESLSPDAKQAALQRQASGSMSVLASFKALRILGRTSLFRRLTFCIMLSGIASDGIQDLTFQYFKLQMGFTVRDYTLWLELFGVMGLAVQTVVLRALLHWLGEARVLLLGLGAACAQMLIYALLPFKAAAFIGVVVGCFGLISFPAISAIKANNVAEHEQGTIQGALYGAKALATGIAPFMFAAIFAAFTRTDSPLPYFPGAPFLLGAALMLLAMAICATIDKNAGRGPAPADEMTEPILHSACADDVESLAVAEAVLPINVSDQSLLSGKGGAAGEEKVSLLP